MGRSDRPTGPDASILAAKGGGGGGPKVTGVDPNSAPQGTTLDIRVIGSGFEDGSVVTLLLAGKSTPKIRTISTTFGDENNLTAKVTIAVDAEIALYDIEVTPPRGRVVGVVWIDDDFTDRAALWSGGGVELLPLLNPTHELSQAYGINDAGQISGQSYTRSGETARAVRWEANGSVTDLGVLPDYNSSIGWAINDLGWVAGSSRPANSEASAAKRQHAVLWIDDGNGQISGPLDLHPGPEIQSIVKGISDETTGDGKVYVAGTLAGHPVVWVVHAATVVWDVDVVTSVVIDEDVLEEVNGGVGAVNEAGEVVVSGPAVWTRDGGVDLVDPLPSLFSKPSCSTSGNGINNVGMVVGSSGVFAKGRCVQHAVVWTKIN